MTSVSIISETLQVFHPPVYRYLSSEDMLNCLPNFRGRGHTFQKVKHQEGIKGRNASLQP